MAKRLKLQLAQLDVAQGPNDMAAPGWRLHPVGARWSVWVDENFRLTFEFEGTDAVLVDYLDYH
jgi:proteic killer suppression protein